MSNIGGTTGNDSLSGSSSNDVISGGAGNDTLLGGNGDDLLLGEAGNDRLVGGANADTLTGGSGADLFVLERQRSYPYNNDLVTDFTQGEDKVDVSGLGINSFDTLMTLATAQQATDGSQVTVISTNYYNYANSLQITVNRTQLTAADFVFATTQTAQSIAGTTGDDDLFGGSGNDTLTGGDNNDRLFGDAGNDRLVGGANADTLYGGTGNDVFVLERQTGYPYNYDTVADFTQGQDKIDVSGLGINSFTTLALLASSQQGTDGTLTTLISTNYSNYGNTLSVGINLSLLTAADFIFATSQASQTITGTSGTDDLFGGTGNDTLTGGGGNDRLFGDAGNDRLVGGANADTLYGGAGNDVFVLERQSDYPYNSDVVADFTQGQDKIDVSGLGIVSLDTLMLISSSGQAADGTQNTTISTNYSGYANSLLFGVNRNLLTATDFIFSGNSTAQSLTGTSNNDDLFGGLAADTLMGGTGDDRLFGDAGNDRLVGGMDDDTLYGGAGNDVFVLEKATSYWNDDVVADFTQGQDKIDLSSLGIRSFASLLELTTQQSGNSTGALITTWNEGRDSTMLLSGVNKGLLTAADFIFSTESNPLTLTGSSSLDDLFGGAGNDTLSGANGDDRLFGDAGDDRLVGGSGNDTLYGGDGTDSAVFSGARAGYQITTNNGVLTVTDSSRTDGTDVLYGVERLIFSDQTVTVEVPALPTLSITGTSVREGQAGTKVLSFTVSLSEASSQAVSFNFATQGLTATAGVDFQSLSGAYSIAAGSRSTVINVTINGDIQVEGNETLSGILSQASGATLATSAATGTILNDDFQSAFSADAYRALNADLFYAFGNDDAALVRHYINNGRFEGRATSGFDAEAYAALNPDLFYAFGLDETSLTNHYLYAGKAEGRTAEGFDALAYAALNPDLYAAFGTNHAALVNHYIYAGRAEGRATSGFDAEAYAALNPDLFNAFGLNTDALISHYINYGRAEGRSATGFDAETYAALNPDLFNIFGLNHASLINHYIYAGRAEGRVAYQQANPLAMLGVVEDTGNSLDYAT